MATREEHYEEMRNAAKALADKALKWAEVEPGAIHLAAITSGLAALIMDPASWIKHIPPIYSAVLAEVEENAPALEARARAQIN